MFVYFIQAGRGGAVKIGKSMSPRCRLANLQTSCPEELRLLFTTEERPAVNERLLHQRFAAHRIRGEWFRPSRDLLRQLSRLRRGAPILGQPTEQPVSANPEWPGWYQRAVASLGSPEAVQNELEVLKGSARRAFEECPDLGRNGETSDECAYRILVTRYIFDPIPLLKL